MQQQPSKTSSYESQENKKLWKDLPLSLTLISSNPLCLLLNCICLYAPIFKEFAVPALSEHIGHLQFQNCF